MSIFKALLAQMFFLNFHPFDLMQHLFFKTINNQIQIFLLEWRMRGIQETKARFSCRKQNNCRLLKVEQPW